MPSTSTFDVAIVGLGPVGATLANLLGARGISVVAIERDVEVHDKPRAVVLDHEAMRTFQSLGLTERVLPHTVEFDRSIYYGLGGRIIKQLITEPPPYRLGWCPNYLFSQPAVDKLLRDAAAERPSVDVRLGWELIEASQDGNDVGLAVRSPEGDVETIRARYLVACDGGSSPMRRRLGIGLDDLDFDEPWLVVDALIDPAHLPSLPRTNVQYCEPARPCTHVIGPGNHRRWEIMLLPGETMEEMNREERIWGVLARWINPGNARLWRSTTYRFHALVARQWHHGRMILAGDAAHMTPPFLGQGMCQGLRDAANLAWKLEMILRGSAPAEPLLATYEAERSPHVRTTTEATKALGRIICERDVERAAARDAALLAHGEAREEVRQGLIPDLKHGLLSRRGVAAAGSIFPQPRVRHGGREVLMDDVTGAGFRLLARGLDVQRLAADPRVARLGMVLCALDGVPAAGVINIDECDGHLAAWLERHGVCAALVRPDHYVFGTAGSLDAVDELLGEVHAAIFEPKTSVTHLRE